MSRHGRGTTTSGNLSPSATMSPVTMSPSSSMTIPTDTTDSGGDIAGGNSEKGSSSRRTSLYNGGSILSKEEQEDCIFKMLQRQTTSALRGGKISHSIVSDDNASKGKQGENSSLPTSYDVATLQFS